MAEDTVIEAIDVTEEYLKNRLYIISGKRVLLDTDLAEIYGYKIQPRDYKLVSYGCDSKVFR